MHNIRKSENALLFYDKLISLLGQSMNNKGFPIIRSRWTLHVLNKSRKLISMPCKHVSRISSCWPQRLSLLRNLERQILLFKSPKSRGRSKEALVFKDKSCLAEVPLPPLNSSHSPLCN